MQTQILIATFELSDPLNLTLGETEGRLQFLGTLQGRQGVIAGSVSTAGTLYIFDSSTHQATLNFEGTSHRSFLLPDASGTVGIERTGDLKWTAGKSVPSGWLVADGSAVSRTENANLFGEIGTDYGAGDGTTTFNLPDCRGRCLIAPDASSGRVTSIGSTTGSAGGAEGVVLNGNPGGGGEQVGPASLGGGSDIAAGVGFENLVQISVAEQPHNNLQPTLIIGQVLIKT